MDSSNTGQKTTGKTCCCCKTIGEVGACWGILILIMLIIIEITVYLQLSALNHPQKDDWGSEMSMRTSNQYNSALTAAPGSYTPGLGDRICNYPTRKN